LPNPRGILKRPGKRAAAEFQLDGKYIAMGKTHEETLKIARQLVDKAAAEKKVAQR